MVEGSEMKVDKRFEAEAPAESLEIIGLNNERYIVHRGRIS